MSIKNKFPKMGSPEVNKRAMLSKKANSKKGLGAKKLYQDRKKKMDEWRKWFGKWTLTKN